MTPERPNSDELVAIAQAFDWDYRRVQETIANFDSWNDDLGSLCTTAQEMRGLPPATWRTVLMPEMDGNEAASGTEDSQLTNRRLLSTRIRGILRPLTATCSTAAAALLLQWSVSDISYSSTIFVAGAFVAGVVAHLGNWKDAVRRLRA